MSLRFRGRPFCAVPLVLVKNGGDSEFDSLYTKKKQKQTKKLKNQSKKKSQDNNIDLKNK